MDLVQLHFAEVHSPIFLVGSGGKNGVNLGLKLDPAKRDGLALFYDREHQELRITYGDKSAIVPTTNVVVMIEGDPTAREAIKPAPQFTTAPGRQSAQVDTPMGHVFKGPGHGKTGK